MVFVNSIESRTTNLFNPDDDHRYTIQGDFNTFKTNLEAISAELGFTIKQVIVVYNNNEEEGYDRLQEQLQQETAGNSRYRTEVLKYFRKKCKKEMVGSDLKDQINRVLGETPDRQIISDYIQWRKSEQGSDKKFKTLFKTTIKCKKKRVRANALQKF